jgi:hypothetical protein
MQCCGCYSSGSNVRDASAAALDRLDASTEPRRGTDSAWLGVALALSNDVNSDLQAS